MKPITKIEPNLFIFCSQKKDGNMSKKYGDTKEVKRNVDNFFNTININQEQCINYHIINSDKICTFEQLKDNPETDAVIITSANQYVYLNFGDCIPFIAYDKKKKILGFAHLGWNSICKKLHLKLVNKLIEEYNSNIDDLLVYFGPSIAQKSYAFPNPAQAQMPDWEEFIIYNNNLYFIDLEGYIVNDILKIGIKNIKRNEIDTGTDINYFSHYRSVHNGENEGRFIFGVGLRKYNNVLTKVE